MKTFDGHLITNEAFMEMLWEEHDKDPIVYGPYGIELTMRRRNINLGVIGARFRSKT
jgi:hypothetical protein